MRTMKKLLSALLLFSMHSLANAQATRNPKYDMEFNSGIQKVIQAYRSNFSTIQGNVLDNEGSMSSYASKVCLTGAIHCVIKKYGSVKDLSTSWSALIFEGEEFEEAANAYRRTCTNIKKSSFDIGSGQTLGFSGQVSAPNENLRFTGTNFKSETRNTTFKNLVAGVELVSNYTGWEVRLNLFSGNTTESDD